MEVRVLMKGIPQAARLRRLVHHRVELALDAIADNVASATVRLSDINGPTRGGVDKLCRIVVTLRNHAVVVIEEVGADVTEVVYRLTRRLHQNIAKVAGQGKRLDRALIRQHCLAMIPG